MTLQPSSGDALTGRGLAWLKKRDYDRALDDLNRAIDTAANIASYSARASVYEAEGKGDLALADLRKAAELKPKTVFDALSQASAKQRAQQLGKRLPCGEQQLPLGRRDGPALAASSLRPFAYRAGAAKRARRAAAGI